MQKSTLVARVACLLAVAGLTCCSSPVLWAQQNSEAAPPAAAEPTPAGESNAQPGDAGPAADAALAGQQAQVAQRFKRLEELLLKSAEIEAASNPGRSALLQQAAQLGKQSQLSELLARAAKSLEIEQYSQAVEDQKVSRDSLKRLLELLQSENRQDRVREQRDQVRRWIEETDRLRRLQSSLRGRTEGGQSTERAASDQEKLAEKADEIAKELGGDEAEKAAGDKEGDSDHSSPESDARDSSKESKGSPKEGEKTQEPIPGQAPEGDSKPAEPKQGEAKEGESKEGQAKPGESKGGKSQEGKSKEDESQEGKSKEGESKEGEAKQGESKQGESKQGESKQGESKQGESESGEPSQSGGAGEQSQSEQQQQPKSPTERAAERIKRAQQRMQDAKKQLDDAEREGAVEKQREAEQELQAAIEQLEEILRQLREEEIERSLAALEERLRTMLQAQTNVLEETERLREISGGDADRQVEIRASKLSVDERKILADGQRALLLLREEGTSAAFPEAMAQLLVDVQSVVDRLAKADTGKLTVAIEQEIVSSLEEMIEALVAVQKDQKKRKEQRQSPGGQPGGQPGEQPLVDQLAEMRLIRTLQLRVNKRTQSLSEALKDPNDVVGQADAEDISGQLRSLAERQASIKQVTRDIVVGKNQQ
ncbi:MAG: hypothetical protein ACTHOU_20825 [Aureliella sp.]